MTSHSKTLSLALLIHSVVVSYANAEVVATDGSLGAVQEFAGDDIQITSDLGRIEQNNLYHSFDRFSLSETQTATFSHAGPEAISNIISRVTGGSSSNIDGTISSTIAGANFFLINPNGIIFGPIANIDVSGSFHASTADYLKFGDNERFYADINQDLTLHASAPSAFGFLDDNIGEIEVNGSQLGLSANNTHSLVGGNITITDDTFEGANITTSDGTMQLASTQSAGEISTDITQTDFSQFDSLGEIVMEKNSSVDASGNTGGKVVIRGGSLAMDSSTISSSSNQFSNPFQPLKIDINLADKLLMDNDSTIKTSSMSFADSGNIDIKTAEAELYNGSTIETSAEGTMAAGDIHIESESLKIAGIEDPDIAINRSLTGISSLTGFFSFSHSGTIDLDINTIDLDQNAVIRTVSFLGSPTTGDININGESLTLKKGSRIQASARNDSGNINIVADSSVEINGASINESAFLSLSGISTTGGDISINSDSITLKNGAKISTENAVDNTSSGNITIQTESLDLTGFNMELYDILIGTEAKAFDEQAAIDLARTRISTRSNVTNASGTSDVKAGNIDIQSKIVAIRNGATINSDSLGSTSDLVSNDAGSISIESESLTLSNGSSVNSSSQLGGNAGNITLTAENIDLSESDKPHQSMDTGIISISSLSTLKETIPPTIDITTEKLTLGYNTQINSTTNGVAQGGNIKIATDYLMLNNASVVSESTNTGDAGEINIISQSIDMMENSRISTKAETANGGMINIEAEDRVLLEDSEITSLVQGSTGNGGDIFLKGELVVLSSSDIITSAISGFGGDITIFSDNFFITSDSVLDASSELSVSGDITISSLHDITIELDQLPEERVDVSKFANSNCMKNNSAVSTLTKSLSTNPRTGFLKNGSTYTYQGNGQKLTSAGRSAEYFDNTDFLDLLAFDPYILYRSSDC